MVVVALTAGSKLPGWMRPSTLSFLDGPVGKVPGKTWSVPANAATIGREGELHQRLG